MAKTEAAEPTNSHSLRMSDKAMVASSMDHKGGAGGQMLYLPPIVGDSAKTVNATTATPYRSKV